MGRPVTLLRDTAGDPATDTALSRVILEAVSEGRLPETLRVYRPQPHVAFGRQDAVAPGYAEAVAASRAEGFEAVERLAGGRAAVFHEDTVAFAWAIPDPSPRDSIGARFEELAGLVVATLSKLGVDARVGEVAGEYCPGEWSVNARGRRKLMGVGQRIVRSAAHVGGVVMVTDAERVNGVLGPVYAAMDFAWDPSATGAVADDVPGVTFDDVAQAFVDEVAHVHDVEPAALDPALLAEARRRAGEFAPGPTSG